MATDLKIADFEFSMAGRSLATQCGELEDILAQYQSVMNQVSVNGLDSALIASGVQELTHRLDPIKETLSGHKVSLAGDANSFVSQINRIDRF
jgi:hypothetical protein